MKRKSKMNKEILQYDNHSNSVKFILKCAQKRRNLAAKAAREVNSEAGIKTQFAIFAH